MKKLITLLLAAVMCLSLAACGGSKEVELGQTVKKGIAELTISDVQVANTAYLKANKTDDDFLSPVNKDDLEIGESFIKATDEDSAVVVIRLIAENVGKNDLGIGPVDFVVDYDNGNEYRSESCYAQTEESGWTEFEEVELEKVTSGAVEIRIAVWVPMQVFDNTDKSLDLNFHGFTYKIR